MEGSPSEYQQMCATLVGLLRELRGRSVPGGRKLGAGHAHRRAGTQADALHKLMRQSGIIEARAKR